MGNMHRFNPDHISKLTDPKRLDWLHPDQVYQVLSSSPGMRLLDFGAGPGFFGIPLARQIGNAGLVIAADIEPRMLLALKEAAIQEQLTNIQTVLLDDRALALRSSTIDRVLMSLVLHEIGNRSQLFVEARRILTPGGKLVVVEWQFRQTERGPDVDQRLDPRLLTAELKQSGLVPAPEIALGDDCYLLAASKPEL